MSKLFNSLILGMAVAIALVMSYWLGQQAYGWMPPQATQEAQQVDRLFSFLVSLGTFVFLGIAGMIGWAVLTCRAKPGDFSEGHPARGSTRLELLWTVGPTLLVIWIGWQSQHIYQLLDLKGLNTLTGSAVEIAVEDNAPTAAIPTIEVIAQQWAWTFRYPGAVTSDELHLPVNQPVRLVLTSSDVLHGFYVPAFRVKQDIIPNHKIGFTVTPRQAGSYRLQDSQFSGTYFALMQAAVYVEPVEKYQQWLATTAAYSPTLAQNAATLEHQASAPRLGKHWPAIAPAPPPLIYAKSAIEASALAPEATELAPNPT
ncbi:MAG: cytochrome c oxidase subunit II [Almyronema sp.]